MEGMNRLEGDRIEYNYRTNLGVITNGRATVESGVSFSGVEIRREGERQYSVRDARFTSCRACQPEPDDPGLGVPGERGDHLPGRVDQPPATHPSGSRAFPPLYSPVLALPIGPRRTGFLIPRFGYGDSDGFTIKQPFFWAISRSQDATLTTIYRTKRGFELRRRVPVHSGRALTG